MSAATRPQMAAPSVPVLLQPLSSKPAISSPQLSYSRRTRHFETETNRTSSIRGSVQRSGSFTISHAFLQARSRYFCGGSSNENLRKMETEIHKRIDLGRCALVSAVAAFVIQCGHGEEVAIAASYSPYIVESLEPSLSVRNVDSRNALTPRSLNSSVVKKGRTGGSHAKLNTVIDGLANKSAGSMAFRKPNLVVKRSGANLPRSKDILIARQVACSSIGTCPLATISAVNLTTSLSLLTRLSSAMDSSVFRSSVGTSVNLLSLCSLVVWMQRSGQLPEDTPVILSQVAFKLFIPCFLMSKVATTLTSSSSTNLLALPLMAVAQVIVGAVLGGVASKVFFRAPTFHPAVDWSGNETGESSPALALTLQQQKLSIAANTKKQALITAACAFGNSLTLPLVFLSGVLGSPEDINRAAGYLARYMVGWSPAMWSVGFKILTAGDDKEESQTRDQEAIWRSAIKWVGSVMNPPLYGVLVGLLIGGTPLSHLFIRGSERVVLGSTSLAFDTVEMFARLRSLTAGVLSPLLEAATLLGSATLAVQTVVLATSLGAVLPKTGKSSGEASLPDGHRETPLVVGEREISATNSESFLDSKAFWVISLVRLIMLPFAGILLSLGLQCYQLLPPDPVYRLVILAESAMPTAQNLVLLAQLNSGTRPLAGMLAQLLLRQYALSVIPITMWMAIFLTFK